MPKKNSLISNPKDYIIVKGARVNNLKNIDINIPRNKFVVITGISGSGKSSLAFDTIYAEGNRRYMESLSSYARSFLNIAAKPDVDKIENLSPPISIDQRSVSRSPRSTVGTLTEIYDYLRVLFAKIGKAHCPDCGMLMQKRSNEEILQDFLSLPEKTQIAILSKPKEDHKNSREILKGIQRDGYARVRFNEKIMTASEASMIVCDEILAKIEIVIDRLILDGKNRDKERILDSIETAIKMGGGSMIALIDNEKEIKYNRDFVCQQCKVRIQEITPRHFSFNSPEGACPECSGLGLKMEIDPDVVIPNKNLSLAEGAIRPWSKTGGKNGGQNTYLLLLKALARKYKFSINVPVGKLSSEHLKLLLYGSPEGILLDGGYDMGGIKTILSFQGVIPDLKSKYLETKSDYLRREIERYMLPKVCSLCGGKRLKKEFLAVLVEDKSIDDAVNLSVSGLKLFLSGFNEWNMEKKDKEIAQPLVREMVERLKALEDVGLEYLTMARSAETVSGGEAQRIRLAVQIKSELSSIIYVLDEPSIGLHSRDTEKLIKTVKLLRDTGNSLIIVEHDPEIMKASDWIIDMGPGAGEDGGEIIFEGTPQELLRSKSSTAQYLSGKKKVFEKNEFRPKNKKYLEIINAEEHNLKNIDVKIPLERFVAVCGVSGSGKSTLVNDILAKALARHFYKAKAVPGKHKSVIGLENIDKIINITQDPIGQTPRSNAATYTGVFSHIRELFANTQEAKNRGYASSRFSFNMKGGRCESCQGEGMRKIEMHLMPDMYVKCEICGGTRYNRKTLEIEHQCVNIAEVLDMSVSFALKFFKKYPLIVEKLKTMEDVGLGYLKLGQSAPNLSGGEAQRIKLATELSRKSTGRTLYILDEPTIGLHFEDIRKLLGVLDALVEKGNTVLVVEHSADVIKSADWVIELGPEGGEKGGKIVFEGTPDKLKKNTKSWTGKYL